ncbi:MAG: hypothetical protein ACU0DK_12600 [Pseudooceanicola sp.]
MAAPVQVTWAKLADNRSEIMAIGGVRKSLFGRSEWKLSADDVIASIEQDEWRFFVEIDDEREWLELREEPDGTKSIDVDGPIKNLL